MLWALRERLRRWFQKRRASGEVAERDTPEAAATRSGRRTVGY